MSKSEATLLALRAIVTVINDRSANGGIGFSLWETEADVAALATSGFYQEQVAKLAAFFARQPEREVYEVGAQA